MQALVLAVSERRLSMNDARASKLALDLDWLILDEVKRASSRRASSAAPQGPETLNG